MTMKTANHIGVLSWITFAIIQKLKRLKIAFFVCFTKPISLCDAPISKILEKVKLFCLERSFLFKNLLIIMRRG